ncbi:zinc finger, CCHC-type containing protein [Tanacetum coccineum]
MEQYLTFIDHALLEVIVNGDLVSPIALASAGAEGLIPPKTAEQKLARKNELKAKSTLMLAIPDEYILKFHACKDAKSLWEAIKNRIGVNKESKKMQKTILKQNYENFAASSQEGLDKTYDRFQKLISQLEIHGEVISQEDANLKLLRSLPLAWNNIALIMRNRSDLDTLSMDDLYNNLKVYESEIKGKSMFLLLVLRIKLLLHHMDVFNVFSFFANQSNALQLDYEDLEQIDADDLEEMDLKWKVAMLIMRVKRFIKKTGKKMDLNDKETIGFDRTKVECYNCHRRGHFARECRALRNQGNRNRDALKRNAPVDTSTTNALVVQDGIGGYDWSFQDEEGITNFALMAYTSQGSSSSDSKREALNKSNLEIIGYQMGLESLEARIVVHEKNEVVYEEDIEFLNAKDKTGLGYDSQMNESEVVHSVFNSRESNVDDSPVNDRFKTGLDDSYLYEYMSETETYISITSKRYCDVEKPKTIRPSAPIIEEWDTDSDNDSVFRPKSDQTKPKFTKINFVKSGENVKFVNKENTHRQVEYPRKSQSPRDNRTNWNGIMTQKLGNGFESIKKDCFVCGNLNHLIKDCDFHENKMVEKLVLNNKGRVTGQREIRPVWNNAQRVNHQNKLTHPHPKMNFVPTAVLTKSGQVPVNAAKQSSLRAATSISTARPVNIAAPKPKVNNALPITYSSFKAHSLVRRAFNKKSAAKTNNFNEKANTTRVNNVTTAGPKAVVSAAEGNGENATQVSNGLEIDDGFVAFGGSPKGGKITGKGKIRTGKLDFEDVYFVKELKFNLFSVSQICDKKNSILFTETKCLVLSPDFKLLDESQVLLKVPRHDNMYSFDLKNVVPSGGLTCLFANATIDESNLWHRRLGHINFKTMNKLVRGNLVRGLLSKIFENDHTCVACQKGKQHKASCKTKLVSSISEPLQMLHMDLFGPTSVRSINHKTYCLVVTNDFSRCDNGTEFKNNDMNRFCGMKGIKREFSVARTLQQNRVAERKNRTRIEAARTMLTDSLLPTTFWAEAVNTSCYVQNRVLVTKPHNKTPYELLHGRTPSISFMRPFGCPVTILNTLDPLGKFDGKADEGFLVRYSINNKAFRVFNTRTRKVEENLHITFLGNKPNVAGSGPDWLFDIDLLTNSMNYEPVTAGNQTNRNAGIKDNVDAVPTQQYILLPLLYDSLQSSEDAVANDAGKKGNAKPANEGERNGQEKEGGASNKEGDHNLQDFIAELDNLLVQQKEGYATSTNRVSTVSPSVSAAGQSFDNADDLPTDPLMPDSEDTTDLLNTGIFSGAYDDEDDLNNLETTMNISKEHALVSYINKQRRTNHKDYQNFLFACFLSQKDPKKVIQALDDTSWIEAMQEELLQFKLQKVWTLVDLPNSKRAIGTKWVFRNKKDERGIVVRNKARMVAQGYTQEERIDYDEVFAPIDRIEAIRLFLFYASFMGFIVYQMDVKISFLYGTIEEEAYVCQPPGFDDPQFPDKVYKVEKALYGLHQAPKAWYETFSTYLLENRFRRGTIDKNLFIKKDKGDILLVQVYVDDIICGSTKKSLCVEFEQMMHKRFQMSSMGELTFFLGLQTYKALLKDEEAEDVDVNLYKSMIGSLMYLTTSRPDIMFVVCACARFQVTPKVSHLYVVKRIFRYLKGQSKLGLWYPRDSPFDLEAFFDTDYARASLDRKSLIGAKYVAAANCYGQVLWIQNQMLDYGFNFMNTKIHIDNESTICIVKNLVFHAKTKHIEIRHHFIRDSYEKRLIQVIKIHTDHNVVDLLIKVFDVCSISNEFRVKTGGCKVNAARQDLVLLGEMDFLTASSVHYALTVSPTIYASYIEQFWNTAHSQTVNDMKQIHATVDGKIVVISKSSVRSDLHFNNEDGITCLTNDAIFENLALMGIPVTESSSPQNTQLPRQALQEDTQFPQTSVPIPNVANKVVFKEWDDRVVRATTAAASLDAAQASGNISKTQSTAMSNDPLSQEIGSGDRLRVLSLEQSKTAQDLVIRKLKKKVGKLETKLRARTPGMKLFKIGTSKRKSWDEEYVSKQGRKSDKIKPMFDNSDFAELDVDNAMENVEGDAKTQGRNTAEQITTNGDTVNTASIDVSAAGPSNVSTVDPSTSTARNSFKDEMMTIANTLVAIRSTRPRTTSVVIHDVEEEPRRATPVPIVQSQDNGKGKMVKPEPTSKNPIKAQIQRDAKIAQRLHEKEKAELERMQRERAAQKEASNASLIIEFDNVQARMEADALLAARLQEKEREQFSIDEQARFLVETITERKRFTYNQPKNKSFEEIQKLYEKEQKWIKNFIPMDSEEGGMKAASSKKRPRAEPDEESVKRQKIGETSGSGDEQSAEKEKELPEEELQKLLVVVPVEEVYVEALQMTWLSFGIWLRRGSVQQSLQMIKRRNLLNERLFEPDNDDILWKLQRYMHDPLVWRLYDTCGVHHVSSVRGHDIFMLVEKEYPLTRGTLGLMMVARLLVEADSEMSRELLRKIFYQANRPRQLLKFLLLVEEATAGED